MTQNKTQKATVADVNYAGFNFPGLKLPSGEYAISVPQIVDLLARDNKGFSPSKNTASRDFKRILGERFNPSKVATQLDRAKINVVPIETFGLLMVQLAIKGNQVALAITEASITTTIEQAYDIAFDNQQALEEYQIRHKARVEGKLTRRLLTDSIQDFIEANKSSLSDNYQKWIYKNCTDAINRLVFGRNSKKLRQDWDCNQIRDNMTMEELMIVDGVERLAITLIDEKKFEPLSAIAEAGSRLLIKKILR